MARSKAKQMTHIGYAARTAKRLRYDDDPREITLNISAQLAEDLLTLLKTRPQGSSALDQLAKVLTDMSDTKMREHP